jgi:hypothetical protein
MKRHGNYNTVSNNEDLLLQMGDFGTVEYANELINKARKKGANSKRHREKQNERRWANNF